jgi:hypothetical protein
VHWFLIKWRAISIPKDTKVLVFALHALDVPVVGFFCGISRLKNIVNAKPPISYSHI